MAVDLKNRTNIIIGVVAAVLVVLGYFYFGGAFSPETNDRAPGRNHQFPRLAAHRPSLLLPSRPNRPFNSVAPVVVFAVSRPHGVAGAALIAHSGPDRDRLWNATNRIEIGRQFPSCGARGTLLLPRIFQSARIRATA